MSTFNTIALLLTIAGAGAYLNLRFMKLPASVGLMVVALLISLGAIGLHALGLVRLETTSAFISQIDFSQLVLHGLLSFLLFAAALHIDLGDLKRHRTVVAFLATAGVIIATFVTGTVVWLAAGWIGVPLDYLPCLLFGALIAPTDPVAVMAVLKETGASRSLRIKIGCESLFNDGVGVVVFVMLLGLWMEPDAKLTPVDIAMTFAWEGLGSIILGMTLGWLTYQLLRGIDDYKVEVLLTLALAAGGYSIAEFAHVSGPITMVAAGLVIGNHGRAQAMSEKTREHLDSFWELLDEILNAVLFILMGLEMLTISIVPSHLLIGLVAIVATLIGRAVSVGGLVALLRPRYRFGKHSVPLMIWGGLRGGISVALALSLPAGPEKDLILGMTYITVVFSILFQGTTFRHMVLALVKR